MYLEELTGNITLENSEVECKARLDRSNPQSWIKTVGGFSNAAGGTFFIGAEDKTLLVLIPGIGIEGYPFLNIPGY